MLPTGIQCTFLTYYKPKIHSAFKVQNICNCDANNKYDSIVVCMHVFKYLPPQVNTLTSYLSLQFQFKSFGICLMNLFCFVSLHILRKIAQAQIDWMETVCGQQFSSLDFGLCSSSKMIMSLLVASLCNALFTQPALPFLDNRFNSAQ